VLLGWREISCFRVTGIASYGNDGAETAVTCEFKTSKVKQHASGIAMIWKISTKSPGKKRKD
jgi:hypothetical protein